MHQTKSDVFPENDYKDLMKLYGMIFFLLRKITLLQKVMHILDMQMCYHSRVEPVNRLVSFLQ